MTIQKLQWPMKSNTFIFEGIEPNREKIKELLDRHDEAIKTVLRKIRTFVNEVQELKK